jgi:hypothetical protein
MATLTQPVRTKLLPKEVACPLCHHPTRWAVSMLSGVGRNVILCTELDCRCDDHWEGASD